MLRNCFAGLALAVALPGCAGEVTPVFDAGEEARSRTEIATLIDRLADEDPARREAAAETLIAIGNPALPSLRRVRDSAQTILEEISDRNRRLGLYRDSEVVAVVEVTDEDTEYDHGPMMPYGRRGSRAEIYGYISRYRALTVRLLKGDGAARELEFDCSRSMDSDPPLKKGERYLVGLRETTDPSSPSGEGERAHLLLNVHLISDSPEARSIEGHLKPEAEAPRAR